MTSGQRTQSESRLHYRLNQEAISLARQRLNELAEELCRVGIFGTASISFKITDGIIADVATAKKTVDRIRKRKNCKGDVKEPSLKGGGRQGDAPERSPLPHSTDDCSV